MRHYFKIKYGFGSLDYVVVDKSEELEKAIYAKIEKIPNVFLGGKLLDGKYIISIEPDVHSYLGWNRAYEPKDARDFLDISSKVPKEVYEVLEVHYKHVASLIANDQENMIGRGDARLLLSDKKHE